MTVVVVVFFGRLHSATSCMVIYNGHASRQRCCMRRALLCSRRCSMGGGGSSGSGSLELCCTAKGGCPFSRSLSSHCLGGEVAGLLLLLQLGKSALQCARLASPTMRQPRPSLRLWVRETRSKASNASGWATKQHRWCTNTNTQVHPLTNVHVLVDGLQLFGMLL